MPLPWLHFDRKSGTRELPVMNRKQWIASESSALWSRKWSDLFKLKFNLMLDLRPELMIAGEARLLKARLLKEWRSHGEKTQTCHRMAVDLHPMKCTRQKWVMMTPSSHHSRSSGHHRDMLKWMLLNGCQSKPRTEECDNSHKRLVTNVVLSQASSLHESLLWPLNTFKCVSSGKVRSLAVNYGGHWFKTLESKVLIKAINQERQLDSWNVW